VVFPANLGGIRRKRRFSLPLKPAYLCPVGIPAYVEMGITWVQTS
jgi:hypothetical protein